MKKQISRSAGAQAAQAKAPFASATPLVERHRAGRRAEGGNGAKQTIRPTAFALPVFVEGKAGAPEEPAVAGAPRQARVPTFGEIAGGRRAKRACGGPAYHLMGPEQLKKQGILYMGFHDLRDRTQLRSHNRRIHKWLERHGLLDEVAPPACIPWKRRGEEWALAYADAYCKAQHITTEGKLMVFNRKIYDGLYRNGWLDDLHLESMRKWKRMTKGQLREYAMERIKDGKMKLFEELREFDPALVSVLRRRDVLKTLPLEWQNRRWTGLGKKRFLAQVKEVAELLEVKTFTDFTSRMGRAYVVASRRGWLEETGFSPSKVQWRIILSKKGKRGLIKEAQEAARAVGARTRTDLQEKLNGAYKVLAEKGLLDKAGFPDLNANRYAAMEETQAIAAIQKIVDSNKSITNRTRLRHADDSAYWYLKDNELWARIKFVSAGPDWGGMGEAELMAEINSRAAAVGAAGDRTLLSRRLHWAYDLLKGRGLLEKAGYGFKRVVFSRMEDAGVVEHVRKLKLEHGITTGAKLRNANSAAYNEVDRRELWVAVGLQPARACGPGHVGRPKKGVREVEYTAG